MRAELKIFIAGSKALKSQRTLIRDVASNLATDYERKNRKVNLSVYSFENFGLTFDKNGQQSNYDEFIRSHADLVIFVFENKAGGITLDEFNIAYQTYDRKKRPQICVLSKKCSVRNSDLDALRAKVSTLNQYYNEYEDDTELERLVEKLLRDSMDAMLDKTARKSFYKSIAMICAVALAVMLALFFPKSSGSGVSPQPLDKLQAPAPAPQAVVTNQPVPQAKENAPAEAVAPQPKPAVHAAPQQSQADPAASVPEISAPKQVSYENVSIRFTVPDMDIRLTRCNASGTSAYVDFTMTNNSGKDVQGLSLASEMMAGYENYVTVVYDDQGNIYKPGGGISSVKIADDTFVPSLSARPFALPSGIPVKFRVRLVNVDESVSEIKLLKMNFRGLDEGTTYGVSLLEIRDIPISR